MRAATKNPPSSSCSSRDRADFSCSDTPCKCVDSAVSSRVRASHLLLELQFLIAQVGGLARAPAHVGVNQPDREQHQADVQYRRPPPIPSATCENPFAIRQWPSASLVRLFAAHFGDDGADQIHGALAHVGAAPRWPPVRGAAFLEYRNAVLEFAELLSRSTSAARGTRGCRPRRHRHHAPGRAPSRPRSPPRHRAADRSSPPVSKYPRCAGFCIRDQARELIQGLLAQLRVDARARWSC